MYSRHYFSLFRKEPVNRRHFCRTSIFITMSSFLSLMVLLICAHPCYLCLSLLSLIILALSLLPEIMFICSDHSCYQSPLLLSHFILSLICLVLDHLPCCPILLILVISFVISNHPSFLLIPVISAHDYRLYSSCLSSSTLIFRSPFFTISHNTCYLKCSILIVLLMAGSSLLSLVLVMFQFIVLWTF